MPRYPCPRCGRPSFTFRQKQFLGPTRAIRCGECGTRVSVPWSAAYLFNIIVVASLAPTFTIVAGFLAWEAWGAGAGLAVFVLANLLLVVFAGWWQHRFVALVVKDA